MAATRIDHVLHIDEMDVTFDHQQQGYGRSLLGAATCWARKVGLTEVTLTTFRDLPFNGGFYASAGFVVLEANEIPQRLAAILAEEAEHGLDLRERSAMVLSSNSARRALFAIL